MRTKRWNRTMLIPIGLLALLTCLAAPAAAADLERVVASVDEPFVVNGERFEAGQLAVRTLGAYNPNSKLVEISVNNARVGVLLASAEDGSATKDASTLLFARSSRGHLTLVGYTDRDGSRNSFYTFRADTDGGRWLPPSQSQAEPTLLASR